MLTRLEVDGFKNLVDFNVDKESVAIVPVQEMEAWLLLDESAIKRVAGRPTNPVNLHLPSALTIESVANPKEILQEAIIIASGTSGRRLERLRADFGHHRRLLLQWLPTYGPLTRVPSWLRMRADLMQALENLAATSINSSQ